MELAEATRRAMRVRELYEQLERTRYGRAWSVEHLALGFVGDVGDLAKLVQAHLGVRQVPEAEPKLAHELADCLWSVLVLAKKLDVDIDAAFAGLVDELERSISSQLGK